jgi:hypothetical protein
MEMFYSSDYYEYHSNQATQYVNHNERQAEHDDEDGMEFSGGENDDNDKLPR